MITLLELAFPRIAQHFIPDAVRFADDDGIGMQSCFVGAQGGMVTAQNDGDAAPAKFVGDLIGATGGEGLDRNTHQVARCVVINRFDAVINRFHVHIGRGQACQRGQRQWGKLPGRFFAKVFLLNHGWFDERDFHKQFLCINALTNGPDAMQYCTINNMSHLPGLPRIEKICLDEFGFFIRRHRRYLVAFLAIYFYSLFAWRRMALLRAGHCIIQHLDDVLDGDRPVDVAPLVYVDDLLGQIENGEYDLTRPIPALTCFVFAEADARCKAGADIRAELLGLIKTLRFDRERLDGHAVLSKAALEEQHRRTFFHSINVSLMMVDSSLRAHDIPEMVGAFLWCSPMRDLPDDLQRGLINVPLEVLEQARREGAQSLSYDALIATPVVCAWMRQEFQIGQQNLRAIPNRLLKLWKKRGVLEILAFFLEIKRYAGLYARKHRTILGDVTKVPLQ